MKVLVHHSKKPIESKKITFSGSVQRERMIIYSILGLFVRYQKNAWPLWHVHFHEIS
jgi:hypothetical protein